MSSRARVVGTDAAVEPFAWERSDAAASVPATTSERRSPLSPSPARADANETTDVPAELPLSPDQQAHLAALEREAFTKGYAQGERAGLEAGGKRAEAMLRRVALTLEELGHLRHTLIHQTERQMVQLALTLARRIIHREISLDPELAAALAHVALEKLDSTAPATIRLNPEDYTIVTRAGERWGSATVTVVPDPAIARGGCLVESDFGCIDATIDRQLDELSRALLGDGSV